MLSALDMIVREATLFAAVGLLIGGLDDLLVDLLFIIGRVVRRGTRRRGVAALPPPAGGTIVVFVPAWDEAAVIGGMLSAALMRVDHPDYRLHVGLYPNDPATIAAAAEVARRDARVRLVVGDRPGPTTKADCLNTLWRALRRDGPPGPAVRAVVFHDAEDVVHPAECDWTCKWEGLERRDWPGCRGIYRDRTGRKAPFHPPHSSLWSYRTRHGFRFPSSRRHSWSPSRPVLDTHPQSSCFASGRSFPVRLSR